MPPNCQAGTPFLNHAQSESQEKPAPHPIASYLENASEQASWCLVAWARRVPNVVVVDVVVVLILVLLAALGLIISSWDSTLGEKVQAKWPVSLVSELPDYEIAESEVGGFLDDEINIDFHMVGSEDGLWNLEAFVGPCFPWHHCEAAFGKKHYPV